MKAINIGISGKEQKIKKTLINRSRSGNLPLTKGCLQNSRPKLSPYRNNLGIKYYQQTATNKKAQINTRQIKNDEYQMRKPLEANKKNDKKQHNCLYNPLKKQANDVKQKESDLLLNNQKNRQVATAATARTSKLTQESNQKKQYIYSEYLVTGYLSPTVKIRHLQQQKKTFKQKAMQNYQKIIVKEQHLKQKKSKNELKYEMYQKILCNLKRQAKQTKPSVLLYEKLKQSGSMETQQDDHSS